MRPRIVPTCARWSLLIRRGEPSVARRAAQEAVEIKRAVETEASLASSLNTLGTAERLLGLYDVARTTFAECLELAERAHPSVNWYALTNLAEVERDAEAFDPVVVIAEAVGTWRHSHSLRGDVQLAKVIVDAVERDLEVLAEWAGAHETSELGGRSARTLAEVPWGL